MPHAAARVLIAGVGNALQGDDGFGVALANRLMSHTPLPAAVKVIETGIGGMALVQELMHGYEALLVADAYRRGGVPGDVYLLAPELPDLSDLDAHQLRDYFSDTHYATPMRALGLVARLGKLPPLVRIIGCEPAGVEGLRIGLSPAVEASMEKATRMAIDWAVDYLRESEGRGES